MKRNRTLASALAFAFSFLLLVSTSTPVFSYHPETYASRGLMSLPPAAPAVNVALRDGDARNFTDPPGVIAYANTQHSTSPPEFTVVTSGNIWRYNQWIALVNKGSSVRATTNVDTTSLGVQFWGDTNDGWARVLVDGSEVWRGNTHGTDNKYPGGAFVKYLEIYGLTPGKHTISVENLGISGISGGGADVTIFFFGLRKVTPTTPTLTSPTSPPSPGVGEVVIDVWTTKGGQGSITSGGTFQVGDETIIYVRATVTLQAKWTVKGPSLLDSGEQLLQGGKTYEWTLGQAEERDIGQWQVTFQGSIAGQDTYDVVSFNVVSFAPTPTPTPPIPPPPTGVEEEESAKVDAASATELDALIALKMAEGELTADLNMDADGNGKVTKEDVRIILGWAVVIHEGIPSTAQQEIIDAFGLPSQFVITYLLDSDVDFDFLVRTEMWYYPDFDQKITFVAGDIYYVDEFTSQQEATSYAELKPWDFDCFMNYEQVVGKIGTSAAERLDLLPEALTEQGFEDYMADKAVFIMDNGRLAYLQTIGVEEGNGLTSLFYGNIELGLPEQVKCFFSDITITSLLNPKPVSAKISLKKFARWTGKTLKKGARAIHRVPKKVARILPPKLRPVAIAIMEHKLGKLPIWRAAAKINDVAALQRGLADMRNNYLQQARNIDADINRLKAEKKKLDATPPSELGMTYRQWKDKWDVLGQSIPALEDISGRLQDKARNATLEDIARIGLTQVARKTLRNIEKAVVKEVREELNTRLGEAGVRRLLEVGEGGIDPLKVVEIFVDGRIAKILKEMATDSEFQDKIKKAVKEELKKGKQELKDLDKLINDTIARYKKEAEAIIAEAEKEKTKKDGEQNGGTPGEPEDGQVQPLACPSLPNGFTATKNCYAVKTFGKHVAHNLYCYYESDQVGGKARGELHKLELKEEAVRDIFTAGEKEGCRSITPDWMGSKSSVLANTADRYVVLCTQPGQGSQPALHEIQGYTLYRNCVINIHVEAYGSQDIVISVLNALEKELKAMAEEFEIKAGAGQQIKIGQ